MNREKSAGGRPQDEVWKHVERLEHGKWKCKYCGREFAGSASRIRIHLSGKGNGISTCKDVPGEIQEEVSRSKPQTKRRRRSEDDNEVGNNVRGQGMVGNTSSRVAPLQVQDPSPSSFSANNLVVAERSSGTRLNSFKSNFNSLPNSFLNGLEPGIPSSSNNHLANARASDAAREKAGTERMATNSDDAVDSNHHLINATSTAPPGEEPAAETSYTDVNYAFPGQEQPAKETRDPHVDALAVGVASVSITKSAPEEHVADALLKFLMCNKFSSVDADLLKDSYLREFLKRAHQHGVPSSLLRGDSLVIEKSLSNIEHEVRQYMLMVKASWNTTGCTLMAFHLNHGYKGKVFTLGQDMYVYGFYCPKGFIFVEAPDCNKYEAAFEDALNGHSPSLSIRDARRAILLHHSINHSSGDDHLCELSDKKPRAYHTRNLPCLRYEIQGLCIDTCRRSEWAQRLINRAAEIHEHLSRVPLSLDAWYIKLIMGKDEDFKNIEYIEGQDVSRVPNFLSNFISFMLLERKLKEQILCKTRFGDYTVDRAYLEAIFDDSKFWDDGRDLLQVLIMTLRISYVMDTLVPTAGYLAEAIDFVNNTLIGNNGIIHGVEGITFWKDLESKLRGTIKGRREAASYLNPCYFVNLDVQKQTELLYKLKLEFNPYRIEYFDLWGKEEKLNEELQLYSNICNKQCEDDLVDEDGDYIHPVKWWEEYGNDLPLLREQAIRILSEPLNCMCNQVKKHIYQLQGADNFILRLNVRMMEEFKRLGDNIYMSIDLSELVDYKLDFILSKLKKKN